MQRFDYHTWREMQSQPDAWAVTLELMRKHADEVRMLRTNSQYESVVFTGCGSPYYLALAAAALFQQVSGVSARGLPASEVWLNPQSSLPVSGRTLLVAVSRSGETTETVRAVEAFRAAGRGDVLTLVCYPNRPLSALGTLNLVIPAGQEESLAQTRAFTTLYLASVALSALWAERDDLLNELPHLPDVCRRVLADGHDVIHRLGTDNKLDRFYFLGSGARYGLACELSLKMKEMSLSHSEPFHFLEFRHGPKAMVTPSTLLIGLVSESNMAHELAVLQDMRALGAQVLAIGEQETDVVFASGLRESARNALYLPVGQMLAFERALHNGHNPDRLHNLDAVVILDKQRSDSSR